MYKYLIILPLIILGCSKVNQSFQPVDFGYDYFPLKVGIERIYQVDSILFDSFNNRPQSDSTTNYIRELVVDDIGLENREFFRVERYISEDPSGPWSIIDVVAEEKTEDEIIRTEHDLKFIPLVFPIAKESKWDGTAFIPDGYHLFVDGELLEDVYDEWNFEVVELNESFDMNGQTIEDVIEVEANNENAITIRRQNLKFAKGFGLVSGETWILNSICKHELSGTTEFCIDLPWREKASRGYIVRMKLIAFSEN